MESPCINILMLCKHANTVGLFSSKFFFHYSRIWHHRTPSKDLQTPNICAHTNCTVLSRIKVPQLYPRLFVLSFYSSRAVRRALNIVGIPTKWIAVHVKVRWSQVYYGFDHLSTSWATISKATLLVITTHARFPIVCDFAFNIYVHFCIDNFPNVVKAMKNSKKTLKYSKNNITIKCRAFDGKGAYKYKYAADL
jgi:hypothetical protein